MWLPGQQTSLPINAGSIVHLFRERNFVAEICYIIYCTINSCTHPSAKFCWRFENSDRELPVSIPPSCPRLAFVSEILLLFSSV